jgi:hypothetical protein
MFTKENGELPVANLNVFDSVIMVQIIDKALHGGIIAGPEISCIAVTRSRLVAAIFTATNINYDAKATDVPANTNPAEPLKVSNITM